MPILHLVESPDLVAYPAGASMLQIAGRTRSGRVFLKLHTDADTKPSECRRGLSTVFWRADCPAFFDAARLAGLTVIELPCHCAMTN
jgi:hypothetical protein